MAVVWEKWYPFPDLSCQRASEFPFAAAELAAASCHKVLAVSASSQILRLVGLIVLGDAVIPPALLVEKIPKLSETTEPEPLEAAVRK